MKKRIITAACVLALLLSTVAPSFAAQDNSIEVVGDVLFVRPGCIVATVLGSVAFVVSLPFAAPSKSIKSTAQTLIVRPAKAAFTRPVGDMDALQEW